MPQRFVPGTEKTNGRHGRGPDAEGPGSAQRPNWVEGQDVMSEGKKEIDESEAKEGNVAQSGESAAPAGVAAHPVFPGEPQADDGAAGHAEQHASPSDFKHGMSDNVRHGQG